MTNLIGKYLTGKIPNPLQEQTTSKLRWEVVRVVATPKATMHVQDAVTALVTTMPKASPIFMLNGSKWTI